MTKGNVFLGALAGLGSYFLRLPWELLYIWVGLMILDIISGLFKACINGNFSSKEMKKGLYRKCLDITIMVSLLMIQRLAVLNGITLPFGSIVVGCFSFKEMGSILENYAQSGGKLPSTVASWLKVLGSKFEKPVDEQGENVDKNGGNQDA